MGQKSTWGPRPWRSRPLFLALSIVLVGAALFGALRLVAAGSPVEPSVARASTGLAKLPLQFIKNRGQVDRRAGYYVQGKETSVFFGSGGLTLSMADHRKAGRRYGLKLDFLGANPKTRPTGRDPAPGVVSYFKGRPKDWKTRVPTYSKVAYRDVWPGIDLVYSGTGKRLKYEFVVSPGADPGAISLGWRGASGLSLSEGGAMRVSTPAGPLRDQAPHTYQRVGGRRVPVSSSYALGGRHSYGFKLGGYDRSKPLVIDPAVLVYSGFIGGASNDGANNVTVDGAGSLYVSGTTSSVDFPAAVGPDTSYGGGTDDAFVAKVKPDGSGLVYAGFIGGSGTENGIDIAVDGTGAAYVSGSTGSTFAQGFPATGPDNSFNGASGATDAFVAKVNPSGTSLAYATYVGGSGGEQGNNVAVDGSGNAYVTGFTTSRQTEFPDGDGFGGANPVSGFDQTFNSPVTGAPDAFVVKVNPTGTAFGYAGYIGGGAGEAGTAIAVDGAGNAYVSGPTTSNENPPAGPNVAGGFPDGDGGTIVGPDLTYNGSPGPPPQPGDAFVAKVNAAGSALDYAGYIGGSGNDKPFGIAVDAAGGAYVTGETTSRETSFPNGQGFGSIPGFDKTYNNAEPSPPPAPGPTFIGDAFVAKVTPSGGGFGYATYFGGSSDDGAIPIEVDGTGAAYIAGATRSADLPVKDGPDLSYGGGTNDAFVAKLNPSGTDTVFASYIGGSLSDLGIGVAVDSAGSVYTAGSTGSSQAEGFPVKVGPDTTFNGPSPGSDAFVAKISQVPPAQSAPGGGAYPLPGGGGGGGGSVPPKATVCANSAGVRVIGRTNSGGRVFQGTNGNDRICGTNDGDLITGNGGRDVISGGGGNDRINGGSGRDRVNGGSGKDLISGGSGSDTISGSSGNDRVNGNSGKDRINGSSGNDRLNGSTGNDVVSGSSGKDVISGSSGDDRLSGNSGSDRINGNSGNDRISGGSGRDRLKGGSGNDRISGGAGRDRISGGSGKNKIKQ